MSTPKTILRISFIRLQPDGKHHFTEAHVDAEAIQNSKNRGHILNQIYEAVREEDENAKHFPTNEATNKRFPISDGNDSPFQSNGLS